MGTKKKESLGIIDLFAGCGGLTEGFEDSGYYKTLACVEWEKTACLNLQKRLSDKWEYPDAEDRVLNFDIQRTQELIHGWKNCDKYNAGPGLARVVGKASVDLIIGGPPCQAYSVAGRVQDKNGMQDDYRNYLFESYIEIVKYYQPKIVVFENVPGILSAKPYGISIVDEVKKRFSDSGFMVPQNMKTTLVDFSEYGVPQNRKRVIILGINKTVFADKAAEALEQFYKSILPKHKKETVTVHDAIGDLPKLYPLEAETVHKSKRYSHSLPTPFYENHIPRFHNPRDISIFRLLAEDITSGRNRYTSAESIKDLYTKQTGKTSQVHKYYVLRWGQPSNTVPAHLYKDGLRHIHPDPEQARSITVREAARLQTFPDDFSFSGSMTEQYKMVGNAVPPVFSKVLASSIYDLLEKML